MARSATATMGMTTAMAVLPPVLSPLEPSFWAPWSPAASLFDGVLLAPAVLPLCVGAADGVMVEMTVTTDGVSPAAVGVWVMRIRDVRTSVADGGAEEAVTTDVATGGGVLEGGAAAADDAGGGAALEAGGAEDAGGGFDEAAGGGVLTGAADEGAGACEDGGSAEDGGLDWAGDEGAGAGVAEESAGGVTDGAGGDEAAACEGGADDCAGLEGEDATKEETNVLAVPLLDMLTTIGMRNHKECRKKHHVGQATRQCTMTAEKPQGRAGDGFRELRMLVSRNAAVSVLGAAVVRRESRKNGR
jgi:hypothetical protein